MATPPRPGRLGAVPVTTVPPPNSADDLKVQAWSSLSTMSRVRVRVGGRLGPRPSPSRVGLGPPGRQAVPGPAAAGPARGRGRPPGPAAGRGRASLLVTMIKDKVIYFGAPGQDIIMSHSSADSDRDS
jgi:hypothetical protein